MLYHVYLEITMELVEVSLKITVAHLITCLKLAEIFRMFLYGIVSQMNELIAKVSEIKLPTASPYVPIFVKVPFKCLIYRGH